MKFQQISAALLCGLLCMGLRAEPRAEVSGYAQVIAAGPMDSTVLDKLISAETSELRLTLFVYLDAAGVPVQVDIPQAETAGPLSQYMAHEVTKWLYLPLIDFISCAPTSGKTLLNLVFRKAEATWLVKTVDPATPLWRMNWSTEASFLRNDEVVFDAYLTPRAVQQVCDDDKRKTMADIDTLKRHPVSYGTYKVNYGEFGIPGSVEQVFATNRETWDRLTSFYRALRVRTFAGESTNGASICYCWYLNRM